MDPKVDELLNQIEQNVKDIRVAMGAEETPAGENQNPMVTPEKPPQKDSMKQFMGM
jgi:hypothetical protein